MSKKETPEKEAPAKKKIVLPKQPVKASHKSPKNLVIFSLPKVGKTELAAQLKDSLTLDLEKGSDFIDAVKVQPESVGEIAEIGQAIKEEGYPYKYVIVDTITKLEEMCIPYAEKLYSRSPMGKYWFTGKGGAPSGKEKYGNILALPEGAGYKWLRQAFTNMIEMIGKMAPRIILLGHVKNIAFGSDDDEITVQELDLTGALKRITAAMSDAIGYVYRKGDSTNVITFKSKTDVLCGARPDHLSNQEFVISEKTDKGLKTYWDKIYID